MDFFRSQPQPGFFDRLIGRPTEPTDKRMILVYALGALIVVVIVLMLANTQFNFLPSYLDPRSNKSKVESAMAKFWSTPAIGQSLRVRKADLKRDISFHRYTVTVEMLWLNARTSGENNKYRHILHRGSAEVLAARNATDAGIADIPVVEGGVAADVLTMGTMPFGLPSRMNPGIMADPYTNDMLVFVDTNTGAETLRESMRIPDIPLDQPFYLTLVVLENYVEVYINCKLELTKVLKGLPMNVEADWFGLAGNDRLVGQIQNLKLWNKGLSNKEIAPLCPEKPVFKGKGTCPANPQLQ